MYLQLYFQNILPTLLSKQSSHLWVTRTHTNCLYGTKPAALRCRIYNADTSEEKLSYVAHWQIANELNSPREQKTSNVFANVCYRFRKSAWKSPRSQKNLTIT